MPDVTKTINSDTSVQNETSQTLSSDTAIPSVVSQSIISSTAVIEGPVSMDFVGTVVMEKPGEVELEGNVESTQTTPTAPVLATATDLKKGDVVRLVWSGSGPFYNVYTKKTVDATFVKVNANPLPGSQTEYDVGALERDTSYDFQIRAVNGAGTETASNILSATPTIDETASRFSSPTFDIKVNTVSNPDAVLATVVLGYGSDISRATFTIHQDPDTGTFPAYNDDVEIILNGRSILEGKIKGVTSRISEGGLFKTFTVLSGIVALEEKVVDVDDSEFNDETVEDEDKLDARQILQRILGYIPDGTPDEDPGELHLNDMTLLAATETVLSRLGNYRLYWNKDTEEVEVYKFGEGGDITRQFEKGVNIIDLAITENRESVVNKLTVIGPPREVHVRELVTTSTEPDPDGVFRLSFTINATNVRNIIVEGSKRGLPFIEYQDDVEVSPEEMGITPSPTTGIATWPFNPFFLYGNTRGDAGLRKALRSIILPTGGYSTIRSGFVYKGPDEVQVFIGEVPRVHSFTTRTELVDNVRLGKPTVAPGVEKTSVRVLTGVFWGRGAIRATYVMDGDRPQISVGSGTIERTITDSQYQIVIDEIESPFVNNEDEILEEMQKRADAEFERLNRPEIGGTITVPGDEIMDLKSSVLVNGQSLEAVRVSHNFTRGYTTTVSLTNEIFFAAQVSRIERPEARRATQEQSAENFFKFSFLEISEQQDRAVQNEDESQLELQEPDTAFALYQD